MLKTFSKYCFRIFTILLLLISFLITNVSICAIVITNCETEKSSYCCKVFSDIDSVSIKIEKGCCCEIKEAANQPAEIPLTISEINQKISTPVLNKHLYHLTSLSDNTKFFFSTLSIHSPPKEQIYLLNSNFRI